MNQSVSPGARDLRGWHPNVSSYSLSVCLRPEFRNQSIQNVQGKEASSLSNFNHGNQPTWFAVCSNAEQEDRALHVWGVECFKPKIIRKHFTGFAAHSFASQNWLYSPSSASGQFWRRPTHPWRWSDSTSPGARRHWWLAADRWALETRSDKIRVKVDDGKHLFGLFECEHKSNERIMILLDSLKIQSRLTNW